MVNIKQLKVGDRIKIVDEWAKDGSCRENKRGEMDEFLGRVLTVCAGPAGDWDFVRCEESRDGCDGRGWNWFAPAIEYVVADGEEPEWSFDADIMELIID